jgi:hypothetical protein
MSDFSEKWVPVSELPSAHEVDEITQLTWDFNFPPTLDTERIVFNTRMLGRIQSAAAFRTTHVLSYEGERTEYTPGVSGINFDGTARATMSSQINRAPTVRTRNHDELAAGPQTDELMKSYFKTDTVNELNRTELAAKVADNQNDNKTREQKWASVVDNALKLSLRESAAQHLLKRQSMNVHVLDAFIYGSSYGVATAAAIEGNALLVSSIASGAIVIAAAQEITVKNMTGELLVPYRRWSTSILGGAQHDRYLLASSLTRAGTLIRARS